MSAKLRTRKVVQPERFFSSEYFINALKRKVDKHDEIYQAFEERQRAPFNISTIFVNIMLHGETTTEAGASSILNTFRLPCDYWKIIMAQPNTFNWNTSYLRALIIDGIQITDSTEITPLSLAERASTQMIKQYLSSRTGKMDGMDYNIDIKESSQDLSFKLAQTQDIAFMMYSDRRCYAIDKTLGMTDTDISLPLTETFTSFLPRFIDGQEIQCSDFGIWVSDIDGLRSGAKMNLNFLPQFIIYCAKLQEQEGTIIMVLPDGQPYVAQCWLRHVIMFLYMYFDEPEEIYVEDYSCESMEGKNINSLLEERADYIAINMYLKVMLHNRNALLNMWLSDALGNFVEVENIEDYDRQMEAATVEGLTNLRDVIVSDIYLEEEEHDKREELKSIMPLEIMQSGAALTGALTSFLFQKIRQEIDQVNFNNPEVDTLSRTSLKFESDSLYEHKNDAGISFFLSNSWKKLNVTAADLSKLRRAARQEKVKNPRFNVIPTPTVLTLRGGKGKMQKSKRQTRQRRR